MAFDAAQARTPVADPDPSDGDVLVVRGWQPGYRKIGAIKLLRGFGYGLKPAKRLAERIMEEDCVRIPLPDYVRSDLAAARLDALGARTTVETGQRVSTKEKKMPSRKVYHVVPSDNGWSVKAEGASRASRIAPTKAAAIAAGKDLAKPAPLGQLKVHKQDGSIQTEYTYGNDPRSRKG